MSFAPITKEQRKQVEDDIEYKENAMQEKAKMIKEWWKKQPHIPQVPDQIADKMISGFLIGTKLSTERTKFKIDTYYAMRHQLPEVFHNRDPAQQDIRDSVDKIRFFPLQQLTPDCIRVNVISYNPEKSMKFGGQDIVALYKRIMAVSDYRMQNEYCRGEYVVMDNRGLYLSHVTELPWVLIQKFTELCQEGLPVRLKGIFVINAPSFIDTVINIVKPALKEKVRNRIHVYSGDHTNLYKYIPSKILPSDFGGNGPSIEEQSRAWQKTIESMSEFFIEDTKRKTDESKRPSDSPNICGQMFGMNGTFTKLNID